MKILNLKSKILNCERGFTLFEIIVVVAILSVISTIIIANFFVFQKKTDLDNGFQEAVAVLKLAQNTTLASENNSQYGVYFDTAVSPNQYILFKGTAYALRDVSFDKIYLLPQTVEFFEISLGSGSEVVFDKLTGTTGQSGSASLRLKSDTSQTKVFYISSSGAIGFQPLATPSDNNRVKDSRHLHFDYSRNINTSNENITLIFNNNVEELIPISAYLVSGQLDWQKTVNVNGSNQIVRVRTHRLNNPDTQFSIHRDRRFNNTPLKIIISGDGSGSLVEYSADGLTTTYSSIYVSNFGWQ